MEITGLFVYPVKSCRGVPLTAAQLGPRGFPHDREFLVVDESYAFLTQRNAPGLATVEIAFGATRLELQAPNADKLYLSLGESERPEVDTLRRVTIFNDQLWADDVGDAAADWFSAVLHRPTRLVRTGASSSRKVRPADIAEAHRAAEGPEISFTDAFPTLLVSEESLADLNTRLPEPIPMSRFRPNIVVRGCAAYDENTWHSLRSGEVVFGCATTCLRCVVTSIDQQTGMRQGAEPLRTLATYRRSPEGNGVIFGAYLIHSGVGTLSLGDSLTFR